MDWNKVFGLLLQEGLSISLILLFALVVGLLSKYKEIFHLYLDLKSNKIEKLEKALESGYLDEHHKAILRNELREIHLNESIGIKTHSELREKLLDVHTFCKGRVRLAHFKRAASSLKLEEGEIRPTISKVFMVWSHVELFLAIVIWICFVFIVVFYLVFPSLELASFPLIVLTFPFISYMFLLDGAKFYSVKHVMNEYHAMLDYVEVERD